MLHQDNVHQTINAIEQYPQVGAPEPQRWFDEVGQLLPLRYTIVDREIKEAMGRIPALKDYPLDNPLPERMAWAKAHGWMIGAMYQRCSTHMQDSYEGQIIECVQLALVKKIMVFPELIAGDEGITGRKSRRPGLQLLQSWITRKRMTAIVTFSVSRWFRSLLKGLVFIQDDVVGNDIRAVAKAENFDTADDSWKTFATVNLLIAEKQVEAQSTFVRMGHRARVQNGFLIGACPLGYYPEPVPDAGTTKLGRPKTRPKKHERTAALIFQVFGPNPRL